jgi:hypothetical protein
MLKNGEIHSDVFSKSSHNYLPPNSCHPPSTFKGLISSVGTRLRIICSHDEYLAPRIEEYARYFAACGWNFDKARRELIKGSTYNEKDTEEDARKKREDMLHRPRKKKPKKIAWLSTYDPRVPQKSKILQKNLHFYTEIHKIRNGFLMVSLSALIEREGILDKSSNQQFQNGLSNMVHLWKLGVFLALELQRNLEQLVRVICVNISKRHIILSHHGTKESGISVNISLAQLLI